MVLAGSLRGENAQRKAVGPTTFLFASGQVAQKKRDLFLAEEMARIGITAELCSSICFGMSDADDLNRARSVVALVYRDLS